MESKEEKKMHAGNTCSCYGGMCICHNTTYRGHWLLRMVLGLLILGFVFWAGFKLGEIKVLLHGADDYGIRDHMMMRNDGFPKVIYMREPGMMAPNSKTTTSPATTSGQ